VRVLAGRVVQEDVLRDDELARLEALLDVVRVRLRLRRVLADQVERLDTAVVQAGDDLVEAIAGHGRHLDPPRLRELPPDLGVLDRLVPRQVRRVRSGIVQPLDVVLAAERVEAGGLVAKVARHQHEVRKRPDVVDSAGVLGDPERVEDRCVALARVLARGLPDRLRRDARHLLGLLRRVPRDHLADHVEALGVLADVVLVLKPLLQDRLHHRVDQPDVRARPQLQVARRELRQPDLPWVGHDERRAVPHRLLDP
jgi:hypothetical protein